MKNVLLTFLEGGSLKFRFFYWDILFQREFFSCIRFYCVIFFLMTKSLYIGEVSRSL